MKKDKNKKLNQMPNEASYVVKRFTSRGKAERVSLSDTGWVQTESLNDFNNYLEEYD